MAAGCCRVRTPPRPERASFTVRAEDPDRSMRTERGRYRSPVRRDSHCRRRPGGVRRGRWRRMPAGGLVPASWSSPGTTDLCTCNESPARTTTRDSFTGGLFQPMEDDGTWSENAFVVETLHGKWTVPSATDGMSERGISRDPRRAFTFLGAECVGFLERRVRAGFRPDARRVERWRLRRRRVASAPSSASLHVQHDAAGTSATSLVLCSILRSLKIRTGCGRTSASGMTLPSAGANRTAVQPGCCHGGIMSLPRGRY